MNRRIVVAGTDTEIGKTVFAAGLVRLLNADYWKPVQSGLEGETDTEVVKRLAELPDDRIVEEAYRFDLPASPHISAAAENERIDTARLNPPERNRPLVIELAGGLLVPLTPDTLTIDVVKNWDARVVLCARTELGTINHSLLSLEALERRGISVLGIAFIGNSVPGVEADISRLGAARHLGRLPRLPDLTPHTLQSAMLDAFNATDFLQ